MAWHDPTVSERSSPVRPVILLVILFASVAGHIGCAESSQIASEVATPAATGKERLSDKGSDEQRVNDCKVPVARRTHERSRECPWDVRS